MVRESVKR